MRLENILGLIAIIVVGIALFSEIPTEVKQEAIKVSNEPPVSYIIMGLLFIAAVILFWAFVKAGLQNSEKEQENEYN